MVCLMTFLSNLRTSLKLKSARLNVLTDRIPYPGIALLLGIRRTTWPKGFPSSTSCTMHGRHPLLTPFAAQGEPWFCFQHVAQPQCVCHCTISRTIVEGIRMPPWPGNAKRLAKDSLHCPFGIPRKPWCMVKGGSGNLTSRCPGELRFMASYLFWKLRTCEFRSSCAESTRSCSCSRTWPGSSQTQTSWVKSGPPMVTLIPDRGTSEMHLPRTAVYRLRGSSCLGFRCEACRLNFL